jgi:hypothetical protein
MACSENKRKRMTSRELIAELADTQCRCGRVKEPRRTFCLTCFYTLPAGPLRSNLHLRIAQGYEEAYAKAVAYLQGEWRSKEA